jgi:AraC-like DNA-binding protein
VAVLSSYLARGLQRPAHRMLRNPETRMHEAGDYRYTVHQSRLAHVEDASVSAHSPPPSGYEGRYQVCLPYFGLFRYRVGKQGWLLDSNRALFIRPGWEFEDEHPVAGVGHSALLISPDHGLLDEICGGLPIRSAAFAMATRPVSLRVRLLVHCLLNLSEEMQDSLYADECLIRTLEEAVCEAPAKRAGRSSRVVERAKEILHARSAERLRLDEIAQQVGVTPVYLTQEFSRWEGVPLYQYQLRLRLTRALVELPHCEDITGLALDLGFSSHSHFSSVFRRTFDVTPSQYRSNVRSRSLASLLVPRFAPATPANQCAA